MALTSAFGDPTRRQIYQLARQPTGVTAAQVAAELNLHPNVARHHLHKLAAGGYVEAELERGGAAGRPSRRYRASGAPDDVMAGPRRDDLLMTLLARSIALLPPRLAEAMAEEVGEEIGRKMAVQMAPQDAPVSVRACVTAVAEALTAHGFAAHAEERGSRLAIVAAHCPFGPGASVNPVICGVERGIVRGMLGGMHAMSSPLTAASRALGDSSCVTVV